PPWGRVRLRPRRPPPRPRPARARRAGGGGSVAAGGVLEDPRADEARRDRGGDGRTGGQARAGARRSGRSPARDPCAARPAARRGAVRPGGAGRRIAPGGRRARRGPRRGGGGEVHPRQVDRRGDRQGGRGDRRRPDRARLFAPLAPAVAFLLADRRLRPPQGAGRSARRRLSSGRARRGLASYGSSVMEGLSLNALVIGCGRVGSAIALQLHQEGWDVTVVDENEDALSRLGENWPGTFIVGHGMDAKLLREAGIEDADAVVVATDGDNTNIIIGQVAQKRFDVRCVVVRVLDPARAKFYKERGLDTVCPTSVAIDVLMDAKRTCAIPLPQQETEEVAG